MVTTKLYGIRRLLKALRADAKALQLSVAPRPMMTGYDRTIIECILRSAAPAIVLEIGSGASTLVFPRRLRPGAAWRAFEHDTAWLQMVARRVRPPASVEYCESPLAFLAAAASSCGPSTLVFLDGGDDRLDFLHSLRTADIPSRILLHDASRARYASVKAMYALEVVLSPPHAWDAESMQALAGGLSLLYTPRALAEAQPA